MGLCVSECECVCICVSLCVRESLCICVCGCVCERVCVCACVYLFQDTLVTFLLTVILHQVDFYSTELQSHSQRVMLLIEIYIKKHLILTYINIVLHCYLHKSHSTTKEMPNIWQLVLDM